MDIHLSKKEKKKTKLTPWLFLARYMIIKEGQVDASLKFLVQNAP